ncbi:MAG: hypothetical protein KJ569_05845 [Candidatus Omnitrophica bacterium]|nr:hypothetical protein [Candidatus Omnitrophota bacterium]
MNGEKMALYHNRDPGFAFFGAGGLDHLPVFRSIDARGRFKGTAGGGVWRIEF